MRVVMVVPGGVDPPGGERVIPFVHHLVERVAAQHHLTVLAVGHDPSPGEWDLLGARVINIPIGAHSKADIARVLGTAVRRVPRPDVVHALWANLPGVVGIALAGRHRVPSVVSVCGGELAAVPSIGYGGGLSGGTRRLALTALRRATTVSVATEWMYRHVLAAGGPAAEVVPLGADLRWCPPAIRTDTKPAGRPHHLVHVAGLNRVKDQDLLLRAVAVAAHAVPDLTLSIAGSDTLQGHHARLAAELGIGNRVEFLGHVPHRQLSSVFTGAALHVLTSHHDAGPLAVLEAAACGVPTVGTAVGHVDDFHRLPEPAALAIDGRDPSVLATAITDLLADPLRRDRMATSALVWATRHDAERTATTFEHLYRRLTAN
jgi:glycosyltransferase involved in cell wall biosynthesis